MGDLSQRARDKVSGPSWDGLRDQFNQICNSLLAVSPDARGELTTVYIKFTLTTGPSSPVYAVVWVKSSKRLTVGLALPNEDVPEGLGPAPAGTNYKGLTGYFDVEPDGQVPSDLSVWAKQAHEFVASKS